MSSREGGNNCVTWVAVFACRNSFQPSYVAQRERADTEKQGLFRRLHFHMNVFSFHDRTVTGASFFA